MKSLNENWFAFTLIAVIFGILGFLLGRTTGHHGPKGMPHMMMGEGHVMKKAMFITDEGEVHDLMGDLDVDVIDKIDVVKGERIKIQGYLEDFALSKNEADELIMSARSIIYKD